MHPTLSLRTRTPSRTLPSNNRYEYKWGHAMPTCLEIKSKISPVAAGGGAKDGATTGANITKLFPIDLTFQSESGRQRRRLHCFTEAERTAWSKELERIRLGTRPRAVCAGGLAWTRR